MDGIDRGVGGGGMSKSSKNLLSRGVTVGSGCRVGDPDSSTRLRRPLVGETDWLRRERVVVLPWGNTRTLLNCWVKSRRRFVVRSGVRLGVESGDLLY